MHIIGRARNFMDGIFKSRLLKKPVLNGEQAIVRFYYPNLS